MKTESPLGLYLRILLISLFIALLQLGPRPFAAKKLFADANISIASGDLLVAAEKLAAAAKYYPGRFEMNIQAGEYAYQAGDPKAAITYLTRPGTLSHLTIDQLLLLGDAYAESGDASMAEATWKKVVERGDYPQAFQRLADACLQRKDYLSAIGYLQKQLTINPSAIGLNYQLGLLFAVTDPVKALPYLSQASEIDPAHASEARTLHDKIRTANLFEHPSYTLLIVGRQLANWSEWDLASEAFQRAIAIQPDYSDAWAFLGEALQQVASQEPGDITDVGFPELQQALQLDPDSVLANTFMGLYWERVKDYSQAQHYLERAIASSPEDPYLYSELGNIISKAGDLPSAQSVYEKAIQLAPEDPLFYRLLAQFALEHQIQLRELALPAARQALMLNPKDAGSLDVMAQVLLMLEDYHSAERFSLDAIQADPSFSPAYLHLGMTYIYLGETDLAHRYLSLAKFTDPDSWVATQANRMLDYYFP